MDYRSNRGEKMLSMIGIRLERVANDDKSQWKVSDLDTIANTETENNNISYEITAFHSDSEHPFPKNIISHESKDHRNDFVTSSVRKDVEVEETNQLQHKSTTGEIGMLTESIENQVNINPSTSSTRVFEQLHYTLKGFEDHKTAGVELPPSDSSDNEENYESDDSARDPDYSSETSSSSSTSEHTPKNENTITTEATIIKKKTRKRKAVPSEWRKNCAKRLRNSGKSYTTLSKGLTVPERQMKPPCNDTNCKYYNCTTKFTQAERQFIFENYWAMADIVKQRTYILSLMQEIKNTHSSRAESRSKNHAFYFMKDDRKIRVCKRFFIATLGITNRCIRTVKAKIKDGTLGADNRGKHNKHKEVPQTIKDSVRCHISSIPTIESHYTRAHSEKVYIDGSKTIVQLYRDYKSDCENQGKPFANLSLYRKIFNYEFNTAFFIPKKDQCQICVSYENANLEEKTKLEEEYNLHIEEKILSREEKARDKDNISQSYQVACFDLQASLPTPNGQVSSFYYKSKLSTYNFTVCDLTQKGLGSVNCYMWHEGEGKRGAVEIGTCLLHYLKEKADSSDNDDLDIVLYSDNCAGQQKNKYVISAFLYAVANYKIKSVTHKYLVTGHTQNEGDNVHSIIEKNIKRASKSGPIYTPSQYVTIVQTAKKTGNPFNIIDMTHDDFFDLKHLTEQTCMNFNKNTKGETFKFSDISILKVEKGNLDHFFYKTSFKDAEFEAVKINETRRTRTSQISPLPGFQLRKAYDMPIPITKKKFDDLMDLLRSNAIKKSHSSFYNSLHFA